MKSLNILNSSLPQAKKLAICLQKQKGEDGPVLFCATKYLYPATYHLNVNPLMLIGNICAHKKIAYKIFVYSIFIFLTTLMMRFMFNTCTANVSERFLQSVPHSSPR